MWDIDEVNKYNLVSQYLDLNSQTGKLTLSPHVRNYLTSSDICLKNLTVLVSVLIKINNFMSFS